MGCRTEPAAVHIAHVLQRLDFFQFFNFFYNLHDLKQKKNYTTYRKNSIFFYNSHDLQQKKIHAFTAKKKLHDYTVFLYTTYIFHFPNSPPTKPAAPPFHFCGRPRSTKFCCGAKGANGNSGPFQLRH